MNSNICVKISVDPPVVSIEPTNVTLELGDNMNVSCTVRSEALLLKFQLDIQNNGTHEGTSTYFLEPLFLILGDWILVLDRVT